MSQSQHSLMQAAMTVFETRFDVLESILSSPNHTTEAEYEVLSAVSSVKPSILCSPPNNAIEAKTEVHSAVSSVRPSIQVQAPLRQPCSRYCRCRCHKTSTLSSPSWTRKLVGSLLAQSSGGTWFKAPCDMPTCRWEPSKSVRVVYSFPEWLLGRTVFISASWGSLTNAGASLHLAVPRVSEPRGVFHAIHEYHPDFIREKVSRRELVPTDLMANGHGYLAVSYTISTDSQNINRKAITKLM